MAQKRRTGSEERRERRRIVQPLEGNWWGSSGAMRCRIGDLSESGCFVQSLMNPTVGEATKVSIFVGQDTITLDCTIVYTEPSMGFAVRFDNVTPEQASALSELIAAVEPEPPAKA